MAFVEVVRRSMRPEEWTDLRFSWIKRGLIEKQFAITDLQINKYLKFSFQKVK